MDDAQLQAMMQQWRDRRAKQMDEMKVRQWCVELAVKAATERGSNVTYDVATTAERIFRFVTTPFADTFKPSAD